ncbi:D-hexose-6-phosphate mutarotase [Pseudoxanthomonas broegbernensis]|uniref:glucose-6-phosphate 1-epimerase n=1 Tax=Pseudoxanthomonas broegbernensis TaxID=83619 RepID=A0A7V8K7T3_9GAMM|nr:D-hexose-6-phosphate mutarotase [Pseudoxanthomonas broegbernensis]MBB6065523.1 glucose-6-phosphate 1-epimerase [Pseudoxanthomonas broegbernensis]
MNPVPSLLLNLAALGLAACAPARGPAQASVAPAGTDLSSGVDAAPAPTAFRLPPGYGGLVHSPSPVSQRISSMPHDIPGLRLGTFQGLDALLVRTPHASAAVALFGGQLLSFVPAGQADALWVSPQRAALPTPIRGGTPVCWPYFGRQGQTAEVPAHGLVRTLPWQLAGARREDDGTVVLELEPPPLAELALRLRMTLRIGRTLEQALVTENAGPEPVRYTEALHNYFRVADAAQVRVEGLDGRAYLDKNDGMATHVQHGDWTLLDPRDPGRSDRLYGAAGGAYRLVDPGLGRRIELSVRGGRTAIVWNPGESAAARMADVGAHWREFLCLEAANAGPDVVELAPGARHALVQTIAVLPLED